MAKSNIVVLRGTLTVMVPAKKKGEAPEKLKLQPGDPVGTHLSKEELEELEEQGIIGKANTLTIIDAGDEEAIGKLQAELQTAKDRAEKAEADLEAATKRADEAEALAGKAAEEIKALKAELADAKKAKSS